MKNKSCIAILIFLLFFVLSGCTNSQLSSEIDKIKIINEEQENRIEELNSLLTNIEKRVDELNSSLISAEKMLSSLQTLLDSSQSTIEDINFFTLLYSNSTMEGSIHAPYSENAMQIYEIDLPFPTDSYTSYMVAVLFGKENQYGFEYNKIALPNIEYVDAKDLDKNKIRCKIALDIHEEDEIIMVIVYEKNKRLFWRQGVYLYPIEDI